VVVHRDVAPEYGETSQYFSSLNPEQVSVSLKSVSLPSAHLHRPATADPSVVAQIGMSKQRSAEEVHVRLP
jgi:hypothetical protein